MDQRKGGTGNLVGFRRVQGLRNALHQRRLARTQFAAQQKKLRRLEQTGQFAAHCHSVRAALRGELVRSAFCQSCGFGHR